MKNALDLSLFTVVFLIGLGSVSALAQPEAYDDIVQSAGVDQMIDRDLNQDNRIEEGPRSGELSSAEAARLDDRESADLSDGKRAAQEAAQIQRIADIQRNMNQQERIEQGANKGALTDAEIAALENGQPREDMVELLGGQNSFLGGQNSNVRADERQRLRMAEDGQNMDLQDERHNRIMVSDGGAAAPGDLAQLGQALQSNAAELEQARQTEQQDFQQLRADEHTGNMTGVQEDRTNLTAQQQTVQADRQTVRNDIAASRQALQSEIRVIRQDQLALRTDLQQTRTDRHDENTAGLQQDLTNDQTARQNLQMADAALQEDRTAVDLNAPLDVASAGGRNRAGFGHNRDHDRFASNDLEQLNVMGGSGSTGRQPEAGSSTTGTAASHITAVSHVSRR